MSSSGWFPRGRGVLERVLVLFMLATSGPGATPYGETGAGNPPSTNPCPVPRCDGRVTQGASGRWICNANQVHNFPPEKFPRP